MGKQLILGEDTDMLKDTVSGICAGLLILIGCCVYLAAESVYAGAIFFSVALLCICYKGYALFTGRVGYLPEKHDRAAVQALLLALLGNAIATCLIGYAVAYAIPSIVPRAALICTAKLEQTLLQAFIRAIFCGMLMYLAVSIYRDHKSIAAIFFCVPAFILSGFEHSIADMGYFAISGLLSFKATLFIAVVILGNAVGGVLLPLLQSAGERSR